MFLRKSLIHHVNGHRCAAVGEQADYDVIADSDVVGDAHAHR